MKTVAFYSYKGGVGRTLLVANTAQFLAMSGRRVVALDLDLEAPGLHQKLVSPEVLSRAESGALPGAVDALLEALEGATRNSSLREMAIEIDLPSGISGSLFLIPAGSAPSHAYWAALERLNNSFRSDRRNGGLLEAILELQARIAEELAPDFLLVDSRTGITELGGLATSLLADRVVCLTAVHCSSQAGFTRRSPNTSPISRSSALTILRFSMHSKPCRPDRLQPIGRGGAFRASRSKRYAIGS
jgi:CobQ/CobB/MinD/ParA nucleotide binding domain